MIDHDIQFDRQKFKAVVQYVCGSPSATRLGKVKLNKIIYFADMLRFLAAFRPLTGAEYQKQPFGPVAKHLSWAVDELAREGKLRVERLVEFGFPTLRYHALEPPPSGQLSDADHRLLDEVIDFVCSRSARAISEISHNAAWGAVGLGESIPYASAFMLVPRDVTDEDVSWGREEARRIFDAA